MIIATLILAFLLFVAYFFFIAIICTSPFPLFLGIGFGVATFVWFSTQAQKMWQLRNRRNWLP